MMELIGQDKKVGDLVKVKALYPNLHGHVYRFRQLPYGVEDDVRYIDASELIGKTGIIISDAGRLEGYSSDGVYHIAFGSVVIRAFHEYFEKVEKTLNKINN